MNLATERATVTVDPAVAGRAEVVAAIDAAGYDVRPETAATLAARGRPRGRPSRQRERRALLDRGGRLDRGRRGRDAPDVLAADGDPADDAQLDRARPRDVHPGLGRPPVLCRRACAPPGTARRTWTRWSPSGRAPPGATASSSTLFPAIVEGAGLHPETYFDSSTIIIGLVLLGRWLEARAKDQTRGRHPAADRAAAAHRPADRGRRRDRRAARGDPRRRPAAGPPRREGAGRRGRRRGPGLRSTSRC